MGSTRAMYYLIWAVVLVAMLAMHNLLQSRPGRAIRALKSGVVMAEAMGVDTRRMKLKVFIL
jgi:branched-chain amino acid transport system permease protein